MIAKADLNTVFMVFLITVGPYTEVIILGNYFRIICFREVLGDNGKWY